MFLCVVVVNSVLLCGSYLPMHHHCTAGRCAWSTSPTVQHSRWPGGGGGDVLCNLRYFPLCTPSLSPAPIDVTFLRPVVDDGGIKWTYITRSSLTISLKSSRPVDVNRSMCMQCCTRSLAWSTATPPPCMLGPLAMLEGRDGGGRSGSLLAAGCGSLLL